VIVNESRNELFYGLLLASLFYLFAREVAVTVYLVQKGKGFP